MATKLPVAQNRMFHNVFICRNCNRRIRSQAVRIISQKVKCPGCGRHVFRPVRKK